PACPPSSPPPVAAHMHRMPEEAALAGHLHLVPGDLALGAAAEELRDVREERQVIDVVREVRRESGALDPALGPLGDVEDPGIVVDHADGLHLADRDVMHAAL